MNDHLLSTGRYALLLAQRWRLILMTTAVTAAVALAASLYIAATAPIYEARALVLISSPRFQVELEPKLRTNQENYTSTVLSNRLQVVLAFAGGPDIQDGVLRRLSNKSPGLGSLDAEVQVRPINNTFILQVSARARNPQWAADVANAWAEQVADRIEQVYGISGGARTVGAELDTTRQAYVLAEQELARFNVESSYDALALRVKSKEEEINAQEAQR